MYSQHICRLFVILFWESHMNFVAVLSEIQFLTVKQYILHLAARMYCCRGRQGVFRIGGQINRIDFVTLCGIGKCCLAVRRGRAGFINGETVLFQPCTNVRKNRIYLLRQSAVRARPDIEREIAALCHDIASMCITVLASL